MVIFFQMAHERLVKAAQQVSTGFDDFRIEEAPAVASASLTNAPEEVFAGTDALIKKLSVVLKVKEAESEKEASRSRGTIRLAKTECSPSKTRKKAPHQQNRKRKIFQGSNRFCKKFTRSSTRNKILIQAQIFIIERSQ